MKLMRSVGLLLSIAIIAPAFAASPDVKDWEHSPQAYFMTKAEQREWTEIKTQEEAQRFIDQFLAKRSPGFADAVSARAAKADKYFTVGKLPGSKTLRGKTVIVLGPPSTMDVSDIEGNILQHTSGVHHDDYSRGERMGGAYYMLKGYHLVYTSAPGGPIDVTISSDSNTGKDEPRDRSDAKQLDAAFEAAAQASIRTK
jgi:GWxTD domain-containing protein